MIKSKYFWIGTILLATIPLFLIDITEHYLSFEKEVREELINVVHDVYHFSQEQKGQILDRVFERNEELNFLIYTKAFLCVLFLAVSIYLFRLYLTIDKTNKLKPIAFAILTILLFVSVKVLLVTQFNHNSKIKILNIEDDALTLDHLIEEHFKGNVVYVDFWGTTCGPCLDEFRNFTKPLKDNYRSNTELKYLYVSQGIKYLWKRQIEKNDIEGSHVFLDIEQYRSIYRNSIQNDTSQILMPHYLIIDKHGEVVVKDARRPSDKDSLFAQLDKYLTK